MILNESRVSFYCGQVCFSLICASYFRSQWYFNDNALAKLTLGRKCNFFPRPFIYITNNYNVTVLCHHHSLLLQFQTSKISKINIWTYSWATRTNANVPSHTIIMPTVIKVRKTIKTSIWNSGTEYKVFHITTLPHTKPYQSIFSHMDTK